MVSRKSQSFPRLLAASGDDIAAEMAQARNLGFSGCLVTVAALARDGAETELHALVDQARAHEIALWLTLEIDRVPLDHPIAARFAEAFAIRRAIADGPVDPRRQPRLRGLALARFAEGDADRLLHWWSDRITMLSGIGIAGFLVRHPGAAPASTWRRILASVDDDRQAVFIADTTGISRAKLVGLAGAGFDYCLSSLPWWDLRSSWLVEERRALAEIAPVIAPAAQPGECWPQTSRERLTRIRLAGAIGAGWIAPSGFERIGADNLSDEIRAANALMRSEPTLSAPGAVQALTGPGARITAILRSDAADIRQSERAILALINPDTRSSAIMDRSILANAAADFDATTPSDTDRLKTPLDPGEVRMIALTRSRPVATTPARGADSAIAAARDARIVIDGIAPSAGRPGYAVKRTVGETLLVEADIFTDGHEQIAARALFKPDDERTWIPAEMTPVGNDRWRAELSLARLGRHSFMIEAWIDVWGGFVRDLVKKRDAGVDLALEIREGMALVDAARSHATGQVRQFIESEFARLSGETQDQKAAALLSPDLRRAMAEADEKSFRAASAAQTIEVERQAARFASWYELFPRSETDDAGRHGTFRNVIRRLPDIARMGFDVLYFPPIHPIGEKNRKGRNNSVTAQAGEPGSPYAIGSRDGGHDAIHPQLGGIDDFRALIDAARAQGIEIALDFAIQCSPDHPWLTAHPGWFAWRPDGSMKYAENPPKKYQDIVNVDFYADGATPDLWLALRDVVLHWVDEGVKIFRVDNPHTKPLPFWRWLIAEIRAAHPDVIFLAEAFTRPKLMYELARLGFSQSYTYFTWRNDKAELTSYLTELTTTAVRAFFRPHFFVNTPDINPYFLQRSGRAGFLIRAALAATLSGLWGIYSGFELCEAEPLPGREEYKDSEKYEIRPRDWSKPGSIVAEITTLNRIRKAEPALQSHLGLTFYNVFNDRILYFGKVAPGQDDKILVAISLDPHQPQEANFEVPLWEWGLPDHAGVDVVDLVRGDRFAWWGKIQHVRLTPDAPYAIWRIQPRSEA